MLWSLTEPFHPKACVGTAGVRLGSGRVVGWCHTVPSLIHSRSRRLGDSVWHQALHSVGLCLLHTCVYSGLVSVDGQDDRAVS